MSGEFSWFNFIGQAVVVVAGWYVVHRLTVARDIDKSRREMIAKAADSLIENLTDLLSEIREYHLNDRDFAQELKIKSALQDAAMRTTGLHQVCKERDLISRCNSSLGAVRRAATMEHFEDEHTGPLGQRDRLFEDVAAAVVKAKQDILHLKHSQFPRSAS
ncbi:hypothetical protein [Acidovorax sp.]|uniref:hypothetical protein n=1 Tax=Acidovorax sp. TaxID=1872122 RepID=UPI0031D0FF71